MATVVLSTSGVANFPDGGGHFWVYMQYAQALRQLGCDVYWLERFHPTRRPHADAVTRAIFFQRMESFGLGGKAILYSTPADTREHGERLAMPRAQTHPHRHETRCDYLGTSEAEAIGVFRRADLLLNFEYRLDPTILSRFRRTALVDIDPGLLQFWIETHQFRVQPHDRYLTIGENMAASVDANGRSDRHWIHVRRPVCLDHWPFVCDPASSSFTTVSSWWGGYGKGEWVTDGHGILFENNKRVSFLAFVELPRLVRPPLELALYLGEGDPEDPPVLDDGWQSPPCSDDVTDYKSDAVDREMLERNGWHVRHSQDVAGSPRAYQLYIRASRGEFSCAKPSCMRFQNAWVSDRTLCYLATGKPAVVQHTGPSAYLPNGNGLFRFRTMNEAVEAIAAIDADYTRHCHAARDIAATHFDGRRVLESILNLALDRQPAACGDPADSAAPSNSC